ncbi:MAG: tetratricopeptide repeat protein [Anaerolineae bacterium]
MATNHPVSTHPHFASLRMRAGAFCMAGLACLLLATLLAGPLSASGAARAVDVPLTPIGPPGSVKLLACTLAADLACGPDTCDLQVEQTLFLYNQDRAQAAELDVGLPSTPNAAGEALSAVSLRDDQGATLAPIAPPAEFSHAWRLSLQPDQRGALTLTYTHPLPAVEVLRWMWDTPLIAAWGLADSVRASLHLPQHMTEDAFLSIEPRTYRFDGRTVSWEYEGGSFWPAHEVTLIAPGAWAQLASLRVNGEHRALAHLLASLQASAQAAEAPFADPFDQIVAALYAAVQQEPDNTDIRMELAQAFRARAESETESRLNYLLLAAQELEALCALQPDNNTFAQDLSQTYLNAAQAADESGDPASALTYLEKAAAVPGADLAGLQEHIRDLTLRWALRLAEQGRTEEALARLDGLLSPQFGDLLVRYAPPWTSAHISMRLEPGRRVVRYALALHPASAERVGLALRALAEQAATVLGHAGHVEIGPQQATLELVVPFDTPAQLETRSAELFTALSLDTDLLSATIASAWRPVPRTLAWQKGFLRDRVVYTEPIDLSALDETLRAEAEYCEWQMVELQNAHPVDEAASLENRLAVIALRDQYLDWQSLPAATYWTAAVEIGADPATLVRQTWLIPWASTQELALQQPIYHWPVLRRVALGGGVALLLVLVLLALPRKRRG